MSDEATLFLALMTCWNGGWLPVYLNGVREHHFDASSASKAGARLAEEARRWDFERSLQVEVGLPEPRRGAGGPSGASVLWCWVESEDQVRRAHRFRRKPTMVLRMGRSCRRLCLWALKEEATHLQVLNANKQLAYALRAPQKWAEPDSLRIPVPGTFLRVGRVRPAPVTVTLMCFERSYRREEIVRGLRDPPAADGWRQRR